MFSLSIVEHLNVVKYRCFSLISGRENISSDTFFFKCSPEAFDYGVVITITLFAHTHLNIVLLQHILIRLAGIFTATVRVMNQASCWLSLEQCHCQGVFDEFSVVLAPHCPAHDLT